jgi:hypothetical protein
MGAIGHPTGQVWCQANAVTCLTQLGRYTEAGGLAELTLRIAREIGDQKAAAYLLIALAEIERTLGADRAGRDDEG